MTTIVSRNRKAFFLYMETERCARYGFDAFDQLDCDTQFLRENFVGKPLAPSWKLPRHELCNSHWPLLDFAHGYFRAPFVSEHVVEVLADAVRGEAEFRSIGKLKGREYFVMNVLLVADCLDEGRAEISYSPSEPARILGVKHFAFNAAKIPDALLFKVSEDLGKVFATPSFVDIVRGHRLTGVGFEDPAEIGVSCINRVFHDLPYR
jgi:hypothetical protein